MRICIAILIFLLGAAPAPAQAPAPACTTDAKSSACKDEKDAREAFARGLKLQKAGREEEAFAALDHAARLAPTDAEYLTARELVRQRLVYVHVRRGNDLLDINRRVEAVAEFQQALAYDPGNDFARERLRDAAQDQFSQRSRLRVEQSRGTELTPRPGKQAFHYRGDARGLLQQVTRAFGITAIFDDSFVPRPVRFDLEDADYATAMQAASHVTKSFPATVSANQVLIAADTPDNHSKFDHWSVRVFYLPDSSTPQELNEILNALRILFEIRYIVQQPASSTIVVHAPEAVLEAATRFLEDFDAARPQITLETTIYEVNEAGLRTFGLNIPAQFQATNISAAALAALGQTNVQNLINQLIAQGGINQANTQAIAALLAQLQQQQNSIFSGQPFATFGGGTTLYGIPFPPASINLTLNQSRISSLEHITLRATQGNAATLRIGTRYPILNATFSPIFNTPQISQVLANQSFIAPFPSFNYEDLGVTLKVTPTAQGELVALQLELEVRALGTQSFNGVPVIGNRSYKTGITVKDGEAAVVAGVLNESEQLSLQGVAGLGQIPGLGRFFDKPTRQQTRGEILVVVTPHVVRERRAASSEIWLPGSL